MEALETHINHNPNSQNRFGRLLLRIPYLKEVKVAHILEVFFNNDSDAYKNFIKEMFHRLLTSKLESNEKDSTEND